MSCPRSATSTAGGSGASLIRSVTSGRSASRSCPGRRADIGTGRGGVARGSAGGDRLGGCPGTPPKAAAPGCRSRSRCTDVGYQKCPTRLTSTPAAGQRPAARERVLDQGPGGEPADAGLGNRDWWRRGCVTNAGWRGLGERAMDRQSIHEEMERARATFHTLMSQASSAGLRIGSNGTRWTNQQLLFHFDFHRRQLTLQQPDS